MDNTLKILIVDDFELVRFQIKKELIEIGYSKITEASDGSEATALLTARSGSDAFDIIFCDWNMPKVNGLDVLKFCRTLPAYQKTPFVMVTAEAERESMVMAVKAGADDYIVKPISSDVLQIRLRCIMTRLQKSWAA